MKIRKGDKITVITGKDKGKKAVVLKSFPKNSMVLVEGINLKKKHQRARKQGEKGKVIEMAHPIHVSNVQKLKEAKK